MQIQNIRDLSKIENVIVGQQSILDIAEDGLILTVDQWAELVNLSYLKGTSNVIWTVVDRMLDRIKVLAITDKGQIFFYTGTDIKVIRTYVHEQKWTLIGRTNIGGVEKVNLPLVMLGLVEITSEKVRTTITKFWMITTRYYTGTEIFRYGFGFDLDASIKGLTYFMVYDNELVKVDAPVDIVNFRFVPKHLDTILFIDTTGAELDGKFIPTRKVLEFQTSPVN
jgi:hypothetical protein